MPGPAEDPYAPLPPWSYPDPTPPSVRTRGSARSAGLSTAGLRGEEALPSFVRLLVWLVALPLGLVVTAVPLRVLGILHADHVIDIFAGGGLARFAILALILPLWAAASATLAHLTLEGLSRRPPEPLRRPG